MDIGSFLIANQVIVAPIIEWGGTVFFLLLFLSPFILIRHHCCKPTRWWHIVGAYAVSFGIVILVFYLIGFVDQWLLLHYFNTDALSNAYEQVLFNPTMLLLLAYPLLLYYSTKLLYGSITKKRFWITTVVMVVFTFIMLAATVYVIAMGLGQIAQNHF